MCNILYHVLTAIVFNINLSVSFVYFCSTFNLKNTDWLYNLIHVYIQRNTTMSNAYHLSTAAGFSEVCVAKAVVGVELRSFQSTYYKFVFVGSPLSTQYLVVRANTILDLFESIS